MRTVSEIIQIWPRSNDLARELGVAPPRISDWKNRNSIPVAYWHDLICAARRQGHPEITADLLVDLHARKTETRSSGFAEPEQSYQLPGGTITREDHDERQPAETGHFTRWKHLRRNNFATADEIEEHIRALRDEWSHR